MLDPVAVEEAWRRPFPLLTRKMRRFLVAQAAGLGVFFWLWVPIQLLGFAFNESERSTHLGLGLLLFGLGLASVTAAIVLHRRFAPEHRAQDALKRDGLKAAGQLLKTRYVQTVGKIPTNSHYLFGAEVPGGPPVFARLTARNGIPVGTPATIAYDPARPGEGVVVETAAQLRQRARSG